MCKIFYLQMPSAIFTGIQREKTTIGIERGGVWTFFYWDSIRQSVRTHIGREEQTDVVAVTHLQKTKVNGEAAITLLLNNHIIVLGCNEGFFFKSNMMICKIKHKRILQTLPSQRDCIMSTWTEQRGRAEQNKEGAKLTLDLVQIWDRLKRSLAW